MNDITYLYHGSPYLFDIIKPQQASGENMACSLNAIYASDRFDYVIPFAFPIRWYPDNPFGKRNFECSDVQVKIIQGTLNPFGVGYVYKMKSDCFKKIDNWQWVAYKEIVPEKVIKVEVKDYLNCVTFSEEAKRSNNELYSV